MAAASPVLVDAIGDHAEGREGQSWPGKGGRPDHRTSPYRDTALQEQGFLVIRRPEIVGTLPALSDGWQALSR